MAFDIVTQQISVSSLPKGVYMIMANGINGDIFNTKLIVH